MKKSLSKLLLYLMVCISLAACSRSSKIAQPQTIIVSENICIDTEGVGESRNQMEAMRKSRTVALENVVEQINTTLLAMNSNGLIKQTKINRAEIVNYKTVDKKHTAYYDNNNDRKYKCYYKISVPVNNILHNIYNTLDTNNEYTFDQFCNDFSKHLQ